MEIRVLLVDDYLLLRLGLRQILKGQPGYRVVGDTSTGTDALRLLGELAPDLVVMDTDLPDAECSDVTRRMLGMAPMTRILLYSGHTDRGPADEALKAGALGYILKRWVFDELLQAVEFVMKGKLYLSPEISNAILEEYRQNLVDGPLTTKPVLAERDKLLLKLIADGLRNNDIAVQLGLCAGSVWGLRSRLRKTLGCSRLAELVRYAIREEIVVP